MKACLIWDRTGARPSVGQLLINKTPHISYLREMDGISSGLRQLRLEQPELVFLAADPQGADHSALIRAIKQQAPQSFLIVLGGETDEARPSWVGADLVLPSSPSEKQLLDGVFRAELAQTGVSAQDCRARKPEQTLPDANVFLEELHQELYKFPEEVCDRHWQLLEEWMARDANAVGWHLVSLTTQMAEQLKKRGRSSSELTQIQVEFLRVLASGPSVPLWKGTYEKVCRQYIEELLASGDPSGKQIVRIRQYIDEHIEEDVSLKRVAQEFFLSTSYLSQLFKRKTGINFSEYISTKKIDRAKALLVETDLTVAEISRRLNYPEQYSFSRFFKGKVGISPQTFRALNSGDPKERTAAPEPVLEDFEITDFGPCAFTTEAPSFAYSFRKRR